MQLIDIGANLTHSAFGEDRAEVISRATRSGVGLIVVTGTSLSESEAAITLSEQHSNLYATAGVHPHHARECDEQTIPRLRQLATRPRVVAVGECGLDFNRNYSPHPDQEKWFEKQIQLSFEIQKPLFLHSRDAHPRFAEILKSHKVEKGVAHCFTGEKAELHSYVDLGLHIGITGWICDERRGKHLLELVKEIPRDRLLLETDAPYLTPRSLRPQPKARRNEPAFLPHVLATVARALGRPAADIAAETTQNAIRLFRLNESGSATAAQRPLAA